MRIKLRLDEGEHGSRTLEIESEPNQLLRSMADRVATDLDTDVEDVLQSLSEARDHDSGNTSVAEFFHDKDHSYRLRLVCIKVHFEGEVAMRRFHPSRTWGQVHRWACRRFNVAEDVCPNLQLREGSADGTILNENRKLGEFLGCKDVWLIAPGPEQNGRR